MLYLPAYWYHAVQGGDGFNVVLAWWAGLHPNKCDDCESSGSEPARREYDHVFMPGAVDELKLREVGAGAGAEDAVAP